MITAACPGTTSTPRRLHPIPYRRLRRPRHSAGPMMQTRRSHAGFTLIELMIVVMIVSILAALAIPSYRSHVIKATRRDAQATMLELASREQQYFVANRRYATNVELGFVMPNDLASDYTATITALNSPPPSFLIEFEPIEGGPQASDVTLTIDNFGNKTPEEAWTQ